MRKFHTTREGNSMLIAQMENEHLINVINLHCKEIKKNLELIDKYSSMKESEKIIYGEDISEDDMRSNVKRNVSIREHLLYDYVFEATLREIDITKQLQETYGRNEKLPEIKTTLLPEKNDVIEDIETEI